MKAFKKIGLSIISLGLISTFYISEAKANQVKITMFKYTYLNTNEYPVLGRRTYALKMLLNTFCSLGEKGCQVHNE